MKVLESGIRIPAVAAVNAGLCVRGGGRVVPSLNQNGDVEYWCSGGSYDGQPVIKQISPVH